MPTDFDSFDDFIRAQRQAGNTDLTPDELVRRWRKTIRESVKSVNGESFADRLRRRGLLGSVRGGPDDLSSNPEHMEGFGE